MVNRTLFWSSVACGALHLAACGGAAPAVYQLLVLLGVTTSLWNHGTTSRSAQVADRATMWLGGTTDFLLLWAFDASPATWALFASIPIAYAIAKQRHSTAAHLVSHLAITSVHRTLLLSGNWQKLNLLGA
jgi:hypothetical protein